MVPWAWGINGCASVVSAILATLLAMHVGFNVVMLLAAMLYALAARYLAQHALAGGAVEALLEQCTGVEFTKWTAGFFLAPV